LGVADPSLNVCAVQKGGVLERNNQSFRVFNFLKYWTPGISPAKGFVKGADKWKTT